MLELTSTLASDFEPDLFNATITANPMDINAKPLVLPFLTGRIDQASCPGDANFLPGANYNWAEIQSVFTDRIGMTPPEVIAIMGAHSLGGIGQGVNGNVTGSWVQSGEC